MSFNFGTPKTATGFTLPTTSTPSTTAPVLAAAGDNKQTIKPVTNLFATAISTPSFSLGTPPKTTTPTITSFGKTPVTAPPSFSLTTPTTTSKQQFSLGTTTSTSTASSFTPIFGTSTATATTITSVPLKLSTSIASSSIASTSAPSLGIGGLITSTQSQPSAVSVVAATPATGSAATGSTYSQLEDSINKWTVDLEEQSKFFFNQAKQLNAWDRLLVSNTDKILNLSETIERIKQQQKQLDQELDFIVAQQNELDELSLPLEKQLADVPITDQNRYQTYQLAEVIDSHLKQMSEDLKEVVEHLNESNKDEEISDPVVQISRILNAHMNSLQWIDRNTSQITSHLEQVSQLHDTYKKNSFNSL